MIVRDRTKVERPDAEPRVLPRVEPAAAPARVLGLQHAFGNQAVVAMLQRQATAERELDARWTVKAGTVDKAVTDKLLAKPSLALTFYEAYETGVANDAEFVGASADFAKTYDTLSISGTDKTGASLAFGKSIAVKDRGDVAQAITGVDQTAFHLYEQHKQESPDADPGPEPQIRTIAIFAHGVRKSLGLDPKGETGGNWFKAAQIKEFVAAIRGHVAGDVRILLFACSTGGSENEKQGMPAQGDAGGEGSFAQLLAAELGGDATVYAHNVAGHTESNPLARVFTADSPTGKQMFDIIYDESFIGEHATLLRQSHPQVVDKLPQDVLLKRLRTSMWSHFVDAVSTDFARINTKNRHFNVGGYGGVGAAMFMQPEETKALLRDDYDTAWLTEARITALGAG